MHGCCADKKYGKGCTEETCMELPPGKTCGDCRGHEKCSMFFRCPPERTCCDFFPRRFREVAATLSDLVEES